LLWGGDRRVDPSSDAQSLHAQALQDIRLIETITNGMTKSAAIDPATAQRTNLYNAELALQAATAVTDYQLKFGAAQTDHSAIDSEIKELEAKLAAAKLKRLNVIETDRLSFHQQRSAIHQSLAQLQLSIRRGDDLQQQLTQQQTAEATQRTLSITNTPHPPTLTVMATAHRAVRSILSHPLPPQSHTTAITTPAAVPAPPSTTNPPPITSVSASPTNPTTEAVQLLRSVNDRMTPRQNADPPPQPSDMLI